ncbi:ribose-phosphate diphosphokinase [Egibacter rhizosphaerae]|uniref:ribose-phosphate diphosphokinase n=1 Tax=Egibacter rhizosphaerae TaxID=1670831 RepID=A0A411YIZ7_9ACTN|nr:ribose-phosphate diphosphokinase [Egibacter rhizosphaerae]QBI21099.1 ribose-phosphate diphosphokinase [Egibacter rhizosphaerae]
MTTDDVLVFGGSGSPRLTAAICDYLQIAQGAGEVLRFKEGNLFPRILDNVRGREVYIVQSTVFPANDHFMELLFWLDAFTRASAQSVTAVVPYFSYAQGDKKDEPRVSIRARVCADAIEAAGADRMVTLDLHAPQIQGFFTVPVDDLHALPSLAGEIERLELDDMVIVAPDAGYAKTARRYARYLGVPLAIGDKERAAHDDHAEIIDLIGDVEGRSAVIVDDFSISAQTMVGMATELDRRGAKEVVAALAHGVFAEPAMERIDASPLTRVVTTDSVENQPVVFSDKVHVVSVAPLFGEAIRRIHNRESISVLFPM